MKIQDFSAGDIFSLINLLDDNDEEVVKIVAEKLLSFGTEAMPSLHEKMLYCSDEEHIEKIKRICLEISQNEVVKEIKQLTHRVHEAEEFLKLHYWISKIEYEQLEYESITQIFTEIEKILIIEILPTTSTKEKVLLLRNVIYEYFRFEFQPSDYEKPKDYLLWNLLDTKRGNSYCIAMLFLLFSKYLNLPLIPCSVSDIVILTLVSEEVYDNYNMEIDTEFSESSLKMFVDPSVGVVLSLSQVKTFIQEKLHKDKSDSSDIHIMSSRELINNYLKEIQKSYEATKQIDKKNTLQKIINNI